MTRILPADHLGSATAAMRTPASSLPSLPPLPSATLSALSTPLEQQVTSQLSSLSQLSLFAPRLADPQQPPVPVQLSEILPAVVAPPASRRALRPETAARQARLPPADDLATHERAITAALRVYLPPGKALELSLTNNHYSMISVRRKPDGYRLWLHRMFIGAQPRIVRALGRYVVHNDRRASQVLGVYIDEHQHIIKRQPRKERRVNLRTAGSHHDLRAIFDRLNVERFDSALDARITWGPVGAPRTRRSIKMGSFAVEDKIIRIHPVLDQADVPEYFVAWIVFHEMLHGKHDIVRKGRRRIFHSQAFTEEERTYPDYQRASAWERANLDRLLGG